MDEVFQALADPSRRRLLDDLNARNGQTLRELCAGLDMARLERDIDSEAVERHITMSFLLSDHIGLVGTPSFIAGDEGAFGSLTIDELRGIIARGRETLGVG